jgi:biotin carboxyl carrier protein
VAKYRLNVNGTEYDIEIDDLTASPMKVVVNGKPFHVTVTESGGTPHSRPRATDDELEEVYVPTVATTFVEPVVDVAAEAEAEVARPAVPAGEGHQVTAPMPGKVLDIAAAVGAQVKQGDTLCNLEAMKMKSPIRSPADGIVAQIAVREGQNVNFGDVLFTLQ